MIIVGNVKNAVTPGGRMKLFKVNNLTNVDDNPFDRQERITGWDQKTISNAKIMVVGAGATGNESLKNLALMGFSNILIADFDTIEASNLSRTILFRKSDKGKLKAEIAAERMSELCLATNPKIDFFHGDVVWELGTGVFRNIDLVLGCLDNVETRFAINRQCLLAKTPWIDCGIYELAGHVSIFSSQEKSACYECNATKNQIIAARKRYSCDDFKRTIINEGKMPTVQICSAIISAIQVQEAVKLLTGHQSSVSKKIFYQGTVNDFDVNLIPFNSKCTAHVSFSEVISLPLSSNILLKNFLEYISQEKFSGKGAKLDFRGDKDFVKTISCKLCKKEINIYKPSFRIYDNETVCEECRKSKNFSKDFIQDQNIQKKLLHEFSLENTEQRILNMTLNEIGVPLYHIVTVYNRSGHEKYYELKEDRNTVFKNIYA